MRLNSQEIEAVLIICSEFPQVIAGQIASLTLIENYRLLPQDSKTIHDLYFDTPDCALRPQKLALRTREIDTMHYITLKGPSESADWGGVERLEIEAPWSQEAMTRVVKELLDRGIKIRQQYQKFDGTHPLEVMTSSGLKVVQDRESHRKVRNVVYAGEGSSPVLAELAIDSVVYHFSNQDIYHHEVEIEAKARDGTPVLKTVIERLMAMYGPALRRWKHSKLAIGMVIEKLLSKGTLKRLLDLHSHLKPVAYNQIEYYLKYGRM